MNIERPVSVQPIPEHAELVFKGAIFEVYQWEEEDFKGERVTFEKVRRPDTVVVFPVLPDGKVVLTRQEQPGKVPFIGATGGRVEEGEEPETAGRRELLEEGGFEADSLVFWFAEHPASKVDWVVFNFIAKGLKKVSEPNLDGGEKIELMEVTFDGLLDIASRGGFSEIGSSLKLMEAQLYPERMLELKDLFAPEFKDHRPLFGR